MPRLPLYRILPASERLYRWLLVVYPPAYRQEYGPLMALTYRDLCRAAYRRRGLVGLGLAWFRVLPDLVTSAIAQHVAALQGGELMTKQEHARAIVAATLPLGMWLVLGLVNPRFVARMFASSPAQPWGWIMSAAILILVGLAYVFQRKAFTWSSTAGSDSEAGDRRVLRNGLRAGSMVLFVLPAILLVVFGPAAMMVLSRQ